MNFAIVDRHGFFRTSTKVRSTHGTAEAAVRVAKRDRVSIPGGPKIQSAAMVITCADGDLAKGETIYADQIGRQYQKIW
jgi:ketosteroid isomerase-like protein